MTGLFGFTFIIPAWLLLAGVACASYSVGDKEKGDASWYSDGKTTASGETFDRHKLTAAHRHLPFGTIVRVTSRSTGLSVDVRINDRGPWRWGRIIDVSEAAANVLKMKKSGEIPVEIEVIRLGIDTPTSKRKGWWW